MPSSPSGKICSVCSSRAVDGTNTCAVHAGTREENRKLFDKYRQHDEHRQLYKNKRWAAARRFVIARDILCQNEGCGHRAATVVHHVIDAVIWLAQGGNFYDVNNLLGLCKKCHDAITARDHWGR